MPFTCQPQLKDLNRDSRISATCTSCGQSWSDSVRDMVEQRRLGAQFMDLLEFESRCADATCGGPVTLAWDGKPEVKPFAAAVVTLPRPKPERLSYPVKAVVKPRQYALAQYALPMAMPLLRPTRPGRIVSVAGR